MKNLFRKFVAKRLLRFSLASVATVFSMFNNANVSAQSLCPLPTELSAPTVKFNVYFNNGAYCTPRNNSYFKLKVQGGGEYLAWCSDSAADIDVGNLPGMCAVGSDTPYNASIYDSLVLSYPNVPPAGTSSLLNPGPDSGHVGFPPLNNCNATIINPPSSHVWNQINWLINHKQGNDPDAVQAAIWDLISPASQVSLNTLPSFATTPPAIGYTLPGGLDPAQAAINRCNMLNDALAHSDFVPGPGNVRAAIFYVGETVQFVFVEIPCDCVPLTVQLKNASFCDPATTSHLEPTVSGGSGNYTYAWTKTGDPMFSSSAAFIDAGPGTYSVTVTDLGKPGVPALCPGSATASVSKPDKLAVTLLSKSFCDPATTGHLEPTVSGGSGNYAFAWTKAGDPMFSSSAAFIDVGPGTYTVLVTDLGTQAISPLCANSATASVSKPDKLTVTLLSKLFCDPATTAHLEPTVSGGSGNYLYAWTKAGDPMFSSSAAFIDVGPGTYTVLVTDQGTQAISPLCANSATASVSKPDKLTVTLLSKSFCDPATTAHLEPTVSGGSGNYLYAWTKAGDPMFSSSAAFIDVGPGTYTVLVTDQGTQAISPLCANSATASVSKPDKLTVTLLNVSFCEPGTGHLEPTVTGGSGNYAYAWTKAGDPGFSSSAAFIDVGPGTYTVMVTDLGKPGVPALCANGATASVSKKDKLNVTLNNGSVCPPGLTTLTPTVTGGSGNYGYAWTKAGDPGFNSSASSVTVGVGTYTVLVTDLGKPGVQALCPASATASVNANANNCDPGSFSFGGSSSACNNRVFWSDNGVKVTVTAFSKSGSTWSQATIGQYSGGLGVTSPGETLNAPQHTTDNNGPTEYLLFQFSSSVVVSKANLGWIQNDSDMRIWIGDLPANSSLNDGVLAALTSEDNLYNGSPVPAGSTRSATFNGGSKPGNSLVIAALPGDSDDYFKIQTLCLCVPSCYPKIVANCKSINALKGTKLTPDVQLTASGGCPGGLTFTATGLPSGLSMSPSGLISGTPTDSGTFTYTVTVTDSCGSKPGTATCTVCVTVPPPPPDTCTSTSTFDFTGGYSAVNGDAGNTRTFSAGGVSVKASAFSRNKKTGTWIKSYLGHYSHGLGVTDGKNNPGAEDGSNNTHTVDNMGDYDNYVLFEFSQTITISSLYLGYVLADSDLTLKIGNYPDPYNNHLSLAQVSSFNSIWTEDSLSDNGGNPRTAVVNSGKLQGTAILVAAWLADDTPEDGFKISTLNICTSGGNPPPPWKDCDTGSCPKYGSCSYKNYCHTVSACGDDIWNNKDSFHYEWQPVYGDCSIVVRCTGIGNTDPWAKAGCMIRETLNSDSKHASCFTTPANGCAFQWRSITGGSSGNSNGGNSGPCWLKLVRNGNTFTGYRSNDGANWTKCGEQNISMGSSCYIGLAVTSHNTGATCTATFDNVSCNP